MKKITIAVGSKRGPKLNAVRKLSRHFLRLLLTMLNSKSSAWKWRAESAIPQRRGMN